VNEFDFPDKYYVIWSEEEVYDENAIALDCFEKLLIAEYIITFSDTEDYKKLKFEQGNRPFYVPPKDELLKYEDDFYYEKTNGLIIIFS